MSEIGDIYGRYHDALKHSLDDYEHERQSALGAMRALYDLVFSRLIRSYNWITDSGREGTPQWHRALQNLRERYGNRGNCLQFAAIDGTCGKETLSDLLVFYGASYAQQGELIIDAPNERLGYHRWSPSEDTSVVAYLPIPLTSLQQSEGESEGWLFRADDAERSTAAVAHTCLMQLAEIYLAYKRAAIEDNPPQVILLDHSLSSSLLSNDVMHLVRRYEPDKAVLGWIGARVDVWGRTFEPADGLVAHSHPMDFSLGVPSWRSNALAECLVARLTDFWKIGDTSERDAGRSLTLDDLLSQSNFGVDREALKGRVKNLAEHYDHGAFEVSGDSIQPVNRLASGGPRTLRQRWYDLRRLFEQVGNDLFRERRLEALQLRYPAGSPRRGPRWMDTNDLKFLIGLGLRLLVETCWRKHILLLGVVKDSASRYFSRNYLSALHATRRLVVPPSHDPPGSDRLVCEMLPLVDRTLTQPWSTVEFDAAYMTLHATPAGAGGYNLSGVKGNVVVPSDGLFLRSLVQMFLRQRADKDTPLMGHVLFLDRLADPHLDTPRRLPNGLATPDSYLRPLDYFGQDNAGQDVAMLVAYLLTRNCFPEAVGQPDPLHRADQGAKALGRQIDNLIGSSVNRLRCNPLAWSFRDTRTQMGR